MNMETLTKLKILKDRTMSWVALVSYVQTTIIYLSVTNYSITAMAGITILFIAVLLFAYFVDYKRIMPIEQKKLFGHDMSGE